MALFRYVASDYAGRKIKGVIRASDRESVINSLRKEQLVIINVSQES